MPIPRPLSGPADSEAPVPVPPHNTSRTCPACGHVAKENRTTQARFACVACGFEDNADLVGAITDMQRHHVH
jgi:putative transposase